jgi:dGTPase
VKEAGAQNTDDVRACAQRLAGFAAVSQAANGDLKRFLHDRVYASAVLVQGRQHSIAMMTELFQFFLDHPDRLPDPYRAETERQPVYRVVCDYIAGMTDAFLRRTHEQMLTPLPA